MAGFGRMMLLIGGAATVAVAVSAGYVYFLAERFERQALPTPAAPRPFDYAAQKARDDALDQKYDGLFTNGRRWTRLPQAYDLQTDASGHVWWTTLGRYTTDDFKRSLERAVAKQSPSIHGGRVLLVDSRGRYWCTAQDTRGTLLCYAGKRWLEPRPAAATPTTAPYVAPADDHRALLPEPSFLDTALDDGAGNVYFVASASRLGPPTLHRFAADGTWSVAPFPASISDAPLLARQCDGRVVIYAPPAVPQGNGSSMLMSMVIDKVMPQMARTNGNTFVWDGEGLSLYRPVTRPADKYKMNQAVPLPDGSILTIYTGTDRVSIGWPDGVPDRVRAAADGLIHQLDARDSRVRESARVALTRLGPSAKAAVETALLDPKIGPERQDALTDIRDQLAAAAKTDIDADAPLFGGRYRLGKLVQVSRPLDGSVRLFAEKAEDHQTGEQLGPSLIRVDPAGEWHVDPLPATPGFTGLPEHMDSALEDTRGQLWIGRRGEQILDLKNFALVDALPLASDLGWPTLADSTGRVYFKGTDSIYVCDTAVPHTAPELPVHRIEATDLRHAAGERGGWCMGEGPVRIDPTGVRRGIAVGDGWMVRQVQPLTGEVAIVQMTRTTGDRQLADQFPFLVTAGGVLRPHSGDDPLVNRGIVHGWERPLLKMARRMWTSLASRSDLGTVASDRGRGLWYECNISHKTDDSFVHTVKGPTNLEYFDGTDWTAVWPLFATPAAPDADEPPPAPGTGCQTLGTVEDGHVLLVNADGKLWGVQFETGRLERHEVQGGDTLLRGATFQWDLGPYWAAPKSQGAYAGAAGTTPTGLATYRDGRIVPLPWAGAPLSVDSVGRLWCGEGSRLSVIVGDSVVSAQVEDLDRSARVLDNPDGRLWLLHAAGLTELKLAAGTLSVGRTWAWNAPMNQFESAFIDTTGGLWLGAPGARVARLTLPQ